MQVSETEILRLYVDKILLEQGVKEFMGKKEATLEGVKDKMFDDMTQYEIHNRRLHGSFDYKFLRERIFDHEDGENHIVSNPNTDGRTID